MLNLKVHHIGYLVKKGQPALDAFLALGYTPEEDWVRDTLRGIDICFIAKDGLRIELVCPYTGDSSVSGLLARLKNSPYHICYECSSIAGALPQLRDAGYLPITGKDPAPAISGRRVQFFLHPALGMIELVETGQPETIIPAAAR